MSIEMKDWIALGAALGGALIVAIGWFVTGSLNRSKDVAQRRLEFRLLALESLQFRSIHKSQLFGQARECPKQVPTLWI
jgi:hypothetical protein